MGEDAPAAEFLRSRLASAGAEHATADVLAAVGLTPADVAVGRSPALVSSFTVAADGMVTVYLLSERMFGMCQFTVAGELLHVTVPLERVRRVARLEDGLGVRVTVELEADRSTVTTTVEDDGSSRSVQVPAGYEMVAADETGRADLRGFHLALVRVL